MADERDDSEDVFSFDSDESESSDDEFYAGYDNDIDSGRWDDDPSPYDGTYSEE